MFAVQRAEFRGGYTRDMPENQGTIINYRPNYTPISVALVLFFLFIITFWGEPDLLDMVIVWMGR